jgi:hypothetical protein
MRIFWIFFCCLLTQNLRAIVKYDEGSMVINGIMLFQDRDNPNFYYYLPPYPRLAESPEGDFEFFCMKYVGIGGKDQNGGLFHALITFSLRPEEVELLEKKLKEKVPKGRIMGVVPMMETLKDGDKSGSSFKLVSSILNSAAGPGTFTNQVLTSGSAPFLPGSKAAIAARLTQDGATLLWESFKMGTSDVSVVVDGYFEAAVRGYNATVKANLEILYDQLGTIENQQEGFKRDQLRAAVDSMRQSGVISIDVFDNSVGTGIKTDDMQAIVDMITEKVIELMFDTKTGWAKIPEKTATVEPSELAGRQRNGDFVNFFFGPGEQAYAPDDKYLLKTKKEIRSFSFYLNLSKSTVIKVPVHTAGNIRGFYDQFKEDPRYFKVVNLEDPFFQKRELFFQLDGNIMDCFSEIVNHTSVVIRKTHPDGESATVRELQFLREDAEKGKSLKSVDYPRNGDKTSAWLEYEYRISWNLKGTDTLLTTPTDAGKWIKSSAQVLTLTPPVSKKNIEIDIDRSGFKDRGIRTCEIRLTALLLGKAQAPKSVIIRENDNKLIDKYGLYMDTDSPVAYQIVWHTVNGQKIESIKLLESEFLFVSLPEK